MKKVLTAISVLSINKVIQSKEAYHALSEAFATLKSDEEITMFLRNLFYILSIKRHHNLLIKKGIKTQGVGAQEFISGRIIYTWLLANMPKWTLKNLNLFFEFSSWKMLLYNEIRTGKKGSYQRPSNISTETTLDVNKHLVDLICKEIKRDNALLAKWLPKIAKPKRWRKRIAFRDATIKVNGTVNGKPKKGNVKVKKGDVIVETRKLRVETEIKRQLNLKLIKAVCSQMGWTITDYKSFRSKHLSNTPEFMFSSKNLLKMSKMDFLKWIEGLSGGQQKVVHRHMKTDKWKPFNTYYNEWFKSQEKAAVVVREKGYSEKSRGLTVKTTGTQSIDILAELFKDPKRADLLHTAFLQKLDVEVPVFCILDGSGSMLSPMGSRTWAGMGVSSKYKHLRYLDVACTIALSFMMKNPEPKFRETFAWFSKKSYIVDRANFINSNYDSFLHSKIRNVPAYKILDFKKKFSENLDAIKKANPMEPSGTNMGAIIEQFIGFKLNPEELPKVLLFITDEEYNRGMSPKEAIKLANNYGWYPLCVFWGIKSSQNLEQYSGIDNVLVTRGFSEGTLTEILRFIKVGSVDPTDQLWAINDMPELSVINYKKIKKSVKV